MGSYTEGPVLDLLKQVQVLDKEIYDKNEAAQEMPVRIKELTDTFEKEKATLNALDKEFKSIQVRQKELENDLASREGNVAKLEGQLAQVKTNKEYSALQLEIGNLKADISMVEEKIIRILDEVEAHQSEVKSEKDRLAIEEGAVKKKAAALNAERAAALDRIAQLTVARSDLIGKVDKEVRDQYESIVKKRQGIALSPLVDENCGICQMHIRPQLQNEVKLGKRIVTCESCGRILYTE